MGTRLLCSLPIFKMVGLDAHLALGASAAAARVRLQRPIPSALTAWTAGPRTLTTRAPARAAQHALTRSIALAPWSAEPLLAPRQALLRDSLSRPTPVRPSDRERHAAQQFRHQSLRGSTPADSPESPIYP